jgi:transcriptional regulator with XRE-family HTH domain
MNRVFSEKEDSRWLAKVVRERREELSLTRKQLSKISSVSSTTIRNLEMNHYSITFLNLVKICNALKLEVELMDDD